jgi:anti-anti-sigma factor
MHTHHLELAREVAPDQTTAVLKLSGRLTLETVHNFLLSTRSEGATKLILDMSRVQFIDSAGVGALVQLFVHRRGLKQKFALARLTDQGRAVIEVCGLLKLIPAYDSVQDAEQGLD